MDVNRQSGRFGSIEALADERAHETGEDVAHAASRHSRVAGRVDPGLAVGTGYDRPRSLEHQDAAVVGGALPSRGDAVLLDRGDVGTDQPRHFAWVGRQDRCPAGRREHPEVAGDTRQRIRIDDQGHGCRLDQVPHDGAGAIVHAQSRTDDDARPACQRSVDLVRDEAHVPLVVRER